MARCYEQSHEAYSRGDGAGAKQLSNEGRAHKSKMESLNKQASDWIFIGTRVIENVYAMATEWFVLYAFREQQGAYFC